MLDLVLWLPHQRGRHFLLDEDHVVRHQAMPPDDQFQGAFAFTDSAFAGQKYSHTQYINQDTVQVGCGQQPFFQKLGNQGDEGGGLVIGAQYRNALGLGNFEKKRGEASAPW